MQENAPTPSPQPAPPAAARPWPADAVERRPVAALVPYARNARTHSDAQVAQIAASITEWGWTVPVLIDEAGVIIAGHGRVLAAAKLGIGEVPVIVARGWTEAQKRAYLIADNKLAENAAWDEALLRIEVADLSSMGFAMPLMGFSADELAALSATPGTTRPGETPSVSLADRFGIVPFSVLNAREGWWQARKQAWIALGIRSEVGRGVNLLQFSDSVALDGQAYNERFKGQRKQHPAEAFNQPTLNKHPKKGATTDPEMGGEV